jgi:hypothetical protein
MKTELNLELHTDNDGIKYYELSKGTPLYRTLEHENGELESKPTFFALNAETVKENYSKKGHGYPHKFILKQHVKLIAFDVENSKFYDKATKIQKELEKYYGMNKQKIIRDSDNTGDTKVLKHICDHFPDYRGYFADQMHTPDSFMHAEVGLCNNGNSNLVNNGTMINLTKSEIETIKSEMMSKKDKQSRKRSKKTRDTIEIKTPIMPPKILSLSPMSPMALNFGDDDDLSPVKKLSFGGRRRTKRMKRKASKTRKQRFRKRGN